VTRSALTPFDGLAERFETGSIRYARRWSTGIRHGSILLERLNETGRSNDTFNQDGSIPRLDGATSVFPVGLAELALEHLARILSRQRFVKRDDLGHLETGQVLANVSTNIVGAQGHSLVEFDRGRDRFAVLVVGIPKTAQSATPVSFKRQASISIG